MRRREPRSCSNGNPLWKGPERLAGSSFAPARAFKHEALYTFSALCTCRKVDGTDRFKPWRDFSRAREVYRARSGIRIRCMHPVHWYRKYWCRGASPRFSWFVLVRGILSSITLNRRPSFSLYRRQCRTRECYKLPLSGSKSCGYMRTAKRKIAGPRCCARECKENAKSIWKQRQIHR